MESVNEIDLAAFRQVNQTDKRVPFVLRIRFSPSLAMVRIILGRVEIGVHAARGAEFEEGGPVRHAPRGAEKSFYDPPALEGVVVWHSRLNYHVGAPVVNCLQESSPRCSVHGPVSNLPLELGFEEL